MRLDRIVVPCEVKAIGDGRVIEGYASVFDVVDHGGDVVVKGAFDRSLTERKAAMLWNHKRDLPPVGVWQEMKEDSRGLYVKGEFADTQMGRDVHVLAKMGALTGLSIGYIAPRDKNPVDGKGIRRLQDVELWEVSFVTFPMNEESRVTSVKSDGELPTEREFERWLRREAGFTEAEAKTIIAKGYRQVRREAMSSEEACGELLALVKERAAIAGDQRHGID